MVWPTASMVCGGGWDKTRRLAIMKDSHIGTYGVIALVLTLVLRWAALGMIAGTGGFALALVVVAALSRAAMVVVSRIACPLFHSPVMIL